MTERDLTAQVEMNPLPRGRHGLAREEVEASQRLRLVRAMAETMAEKGYARSSVADVLRRARVSRETFYALFDSKEDCFMSAFEQAYAHIADQIAERATAVAADDAERERPRAPIDAFSEVFGHYLDALAGDPVSARVFLIEVYAAGPSAIRRRLELQRGLVDAVVRLVGASDEDRFTVEAVLAAVIQLVTARLALGDVAGLRDLHRPVVSLVRRLGLDEG